MATKKKQPAAKRITPKKKTAQAKKTAKSAGKVTTVEKTQKKKQTKGKARKEETAKVARPAKKPVRKVKAGVQKPPAGRAVQKEEKPAAARVTGTARKRQAETARTATLPPRKDLLRKQLIKRREEILREAKTEIAKYIKGEATQMAETALDDGDWSVIDLSADINLRRLESHRERLLGIDEALMKLREGTYGVCEECGGEITAERLKVMPFAVYCRDCQEKKEQLEKIARQEIIS